MAYLAQNLIGRAAIAICILHADGVQAFEPCRINVVDEVSGWPVPLVELRTTHNVKFISDNRGIIAFDLPELMNVPTWFFVEGHGYSVPADGFGYRGVLLTPTEGGNLTIEVQRQLPAKRLGRLTGGGLFGESQQLGLEPEWREQGILGCDSVQCAVHNGKMYWAWGDTTLAKHPLGLFHMTSATTGLQPLKSFEPPIKLRYDYFTDEEHRPRNVAEMPGTGPTWVSGYTSLVDRNGRQRLVGTYVKIEPPLTAYEVGLCVWNERHERFDPLKKVWTRSTDQPEPPLVPDGHPTPWQDDSGKRWMLFGDPFPRLKCAATFEAWSNPAEWQALDPQAQVPTLEAGQAVTPHRGSIAWNDYRGRWVTVFTQRFGESSPLGEIWYAEADDPTGPWSSAIKVVTHNNYTFYNPRLHANLSPEGSSILLFEATYTKTFANHAEATPRYDYNQVLYRLDLDELDPAIR